jgi:hypothetical protein
MDGGHVPLWSLIIVGGSAMLYGLHRFCLWLEEPWLAVLQAQEAQ